MQIIKHLLPFILLLGFQTGMFGQLSIFKKFNHHQIKPRSVNSFHFNVGIGYSFHYLPVSRRNFNSTFGTTDSKVKQKPDEAIHLDISLNHLLNANQAVFFGIGIVEIAYKEDGNYSVFFTNPNSSPSTFTQSYTTSVSYDYISFFVGHRYIFPSNTNRYLFLENSLANDWLPNYKFYRNNFINRSGFSYQFKFGQQVIYKEKRKALVSIYYRTAIVKYNLEKFDKNYYPFSFGVDFTLAFSFKK